MKQLVNVDSKMNQLIISIIKPEKEVSQLSETRFKKFVILVKYIEQLLFESRVFSKKSRSAI